MAVEIIEQRLDDIYRSKGVRKPADVTTVFSYKGREYTIDVTHANDKDFDDAIQPFLEAATEVTGRRKSSTVKKSHVPLATTVAPKKKASAKPSNAATEAIREWARSQGVQVSDRGRIADSVKAAYYAGHPKLEAATPSRTLEERPAVSTEPEVEETEVDGFDGLYEDDPYAQI
jgi:hypothetical protein